MQSSNFPDPGTLDRVDRARRNLDGVLQHRADVISESRKIERTFSSIGDPADFDTVGIELNDLDLLERQEVSEPV